MGKSIIDSDSPDDQILIESSVLVCIPYARSQNSSADRAGAELVSQSTSFSRPVHRNQHQHLDISRYEEIKAKSFKILKLNFKPQTCILVEISVLKRSILRDSKSFGPKRSHSPCSFSNFTHFSTFRLPFISLFLRSFILRSLPLLFFFHSFLLLLFRLTTFLLLLLSRCSLKIKNVSTAFLSVLRRPHPPRPQIQKRSSTV